MVLLAACSPASPELLVPVESALVENIGLTSFGGEAFCAYDVLGEEIRVDGADVYVWALCGEYILENGMLTLGTASSLPVALHMQESGESYDVISIEVPHDGTGYMPSIEAIFPPDAIREMCHGNADCYNERANRLENKIEQKARQYYGLE
jgi:hypothetical protein